MQGSDTKSTLLHMAMVEPSSLPWFVACMRLHNRGVIPSVTPSEFMPGHKALAAFWGPRSSLGYIFNDHGVPAYEIYVRQLFSRVLQLPWPMSAVLPFHFARGLLVEALGVEVNWATFGYNSTHPHQSNSSIPRILPEFRALVSPLPALAIVMPAVDIADQSPLAARIVEHLNEMGGGITDVEYTLQNEDPTPAYSVTISSAAPSLPPVPTYTTPLRNACGDPVAPWTMLPLQLPTGAPYESLAVVSPVTNPVPNQGPEVKSEFPDDDAPAAAHCDNGQRRSNGVLQGGVTFDQSALSALLVLRPSFKASVDHERTRLHMACLEINKPVRELRQCLDDQREQLRSLERKVTDKSRSHEKAAFELRRARDQLKTAKVNLVAQGTKDDTRTGRSSLRMCEQLVDLWTENVAFAYTQLTSCELELKMQKERVSKTKTDLTAARVLFKEKTVKLERSLAHLHALSTVLGSL